MDIQIKLCQRVIFPLQFGCRPLSVVAERKPSLIETLPVRFSPNGKPVNISTLAPALQEQITAALADIEGEPSPTPIRETIESSTEESQSTDSEWVELCEIFRERNKTAADAKALTVRGIQGIAVIYEREESRWNDWLAEHGIEKPRGGPKPKSRFHGILKYLLGLGARGDANGTATRLAPCIDAWLENRANIPPATIPDWINSQGGAFSFYESRKDIGPVAPDARSREFSGGANDIVYTDRELAKRIVDHFRPHFRPGDTFLDPCRGDGAFYDCLPEPREWCEIQEGIDFLKCEKRATWAITNPPWSAQVYRPIAAHAYELCDNVIFLTRWHTATGTYARHGDWRSSGHEWRETVYIPWKDAGFIGHDGEEKTEGFILAAFWWQRGWTGGMKSTYWTEAEAGLIKPTKDVKFLREHKDASCEAYSPRYLFDAMRCRFDLDPAHPGRHVVECVVPVDHIFTIADDGLTAYWPPKAFIWLNAPYGRDIYEQWMRKFADHGNGVALVKDATSTEWYQYLMEKADLVLTLKKKIPFIRPGQKPVSFPIGHHLVAIGERGVAALENAARNGLGSLSQPHRSMSEAAD